GGGARCARDRQRQGGCCHDRAAATRGLTPGTENPAAQNGADVVDDGYRPGLVRIEPVLHLQEGGIQILCPVAEEIERRHQQDAVDSYAPVLAQYREDVAAARPLRVKRRRLRDIAPDVEDEQRR